jgi:hypothetical protein
MNVGYFAVEETTHEYVGRFTDGAGAQEDGVALGMRPPASANRSPGDGLGQTRSGPARGFENQAAFLHEGKSLFERHRGSPLAAGLSSVEYRLSNDAGKSRDLVG